MGGGLDKGISINETLIRFPVCFGFKRLLLMQQCNGMWIVRCSKWNLFQLSVSEQDAVDSCQHQHSPREGKVVRQSWALKRKRTRFSFAPTTLLSLSDRQGYSPICTHAQTLARAGKRRNKEVLEGAGLIRPPNVLIKQLHSILFWFQDLMNSIWKTSARSFGQIMTCSFCILQIFCLLEMMDKVWAPLNGQRLQLNSPTIK